MTMREKIEFIIDALPNHLSEIDSCFKNTSYCKGDFNKAVELKKLLNNLPILKSYEKDRGKPK